MGLLKEEVVAFLREEFVLSADEDEFALRSSVGSYIGELTELLEKFAQKKADDRQREMHNKLVFIMKELNKIASIVDTSQHYFDLGYLYRDVVGLAAKYTLPAVSEKE